MRTCNRGTPRDVERLATESILIVDVRDPGSTAGVRFTLQDLDRRTSWNVLGSDSFLEIEPADCRLDIIEISRIAQVVERWGDRFLRRIYPSGEVEYCRGRAPQLASRFAAKEAMMKALGTGRRGVDWRDIEAVEVHGYEFLVNEIGGGRNDAAEKWDPKTRETADHSLAYILAVTLVDGGVSLESFDLERVGDPALRPLMQKISVALDPATRDLKSPRQPVRFSIRLKNGNVIEEACEYPFGHPMNPASSDKVSEKFMNLAGRRADAGAASDMLAILRGLAGAPDLAELTTAMRILPVK